MALPRIIPWTYVGNFAAGANPWNGQPLAVVPAYSFFTPAQVPTAEEMNFLFGNTIAAVALVPSYAVKNWHPLQTPTQVVGSGFSVNSVARDIINDVWVAAGDNGTNGVVTYTQDGTTWNTLVSIASRRPLVATVHGTNTKTLLANLDGTFYTVTSAGVATIVSTGTYSVIANTLGGTGFWYPLASKIVDVILTSGVGAQAVSSPDAVAVNSVTAIPASFLTTTNNIAYFTSAVKSDGSQAIVGFGGTTPITNPSFLWLVTYPGSVVTIADVTVPAGISGSSITGVAWNDSLQLWGVLVNNGFGILWTSPDLITWTATHTFGGACKGLACVGNTWVVNVNFTYAGGTVSRPLVSTDGVTWTNADFTWTSGAVFTQFGIAQGQLVSFGNSGAAVSFRV